MTYEVRFNWDMKKHIQIIHIAREHWTEIECHASIVSLFHILYNILESTVIMSDKGTQEVKNTYIRCLLVCGCYNNVKIVWLIQHKNLLKFLYFYVICEFLHTFLNLCIGERGAGWHRGRLARPWWWETEAWSITVMSSLFVYIT